jgi:hypothetical protein
MINEEKTRKILGEAYRRMTFPSEYRDRLLQNIIDNVNTRGKVRLLWELPSFWAIIVAVVIVAIIVYGMWLPLNVMVELYP